MKNRGLILFSIFVVAALAGASAWAGHSLPADAQLPMHWNAAGEVDRYGDKWTALMLPPLLAAVLTLIMWGISRIEPQQDHLAKSQGLFRVGWLGGLGLGVVIELMLLSTVFHWGLSPLGLIIGAVGLFFVAMGDQFGKTRPMYMVGIRTPWTLADPEVWTATHRLGGKLLVLAGLVWLITALFGWVNVLTLPILVLVMAVASLVPVVYSYLLWRRLHKEA
ncbi:MAG TPA: SdpI family protein [Sphingomonas sp.]|uniref:SdpI family protein n=1 Tax=Sphingomonas sp. TaxID=28214 RepID=UPI002CEA22C3|nr:SdpI family protein [Sphingomonas sp.]HMI20827.1 SdpI family protein [Sphingomonas sp.]